MNWLDRLVGKIGRRNDPSVQGGTGQDSEGREAGDTVLRERTAGPSLQVLAEWKVGDMILDLYEVKQICEGGGTGLLYRVHHRDWNMDLALKSPPRDYFQTEANQEKFKRECETWMNLGFHPHIVSCYYIREVNGVPHAFAEYVEGGTLHEWIESRRLYDGGPQEALKRILDIAIQTAWGLHYVHERDLFHQEVKPANILMMPDGTAKITGFGLANAKVIAGDSKQASAGRGAMASKGGMNPTYCSPEQKDSRPMSRKTDIWSWAVSVLEMLAGGVRWESSVAAPEVLQRLGELGADAVELPEMPQDLTSLLQKCLEFDPARRPKDASEIAHKLEGIYRTQLNDKYWRPEPAAAELRADTLNNRALSMLDLAKPKEAETLWEEAVNAEPSHPEAIFNWGLTLWRSGRMTDEALLTQLCEARAVRPGDARVPLLEGLVHLERGDATSAVKAFEEADSARAGDQQVLSGLVRARSLLGQGVQCVRTFEGHTESVYAVSLSTDKSWALSGGYDKTLRLWDVSTGRCVRVFEGHSKSVLSIGLSPDGRWALSGGSDKTLRLWDVSTGRCVRVFEGHADGVNSVCMSSDGRWALSGSGDKTLRLWDVSSGRCLRAFEGHSGGVNSVCLSKDGRKALSGSSTFDKGDARLWDVSSGRPLRALEGHTGSVGSVCLSSDGRWALTGSDDSTFRLWEVATGRCARIFEGNTGPVTSLSLSADNRCALSGSSDKTLRLWEVATGRCLRTFDGRTGYTGVAEVCLSPDGRLALSAGGKTFCLWDLSPQSASGLAFVSASLEPCRVVTSEVALRSEARFADLMAKGRSCAQGGDWPGVLDCVAEARGLPLRSMDGRLLALNAEAGLHSHRKGFLAGWHKRTLRGHTESVNSICLSADGRWVLSGSGNLLNADTTLRLWDVSTGSCVRTFETHAFMVSSVCLSGDGRWALSGSLGYFDNRTNTVCLWEVSSGRCVRTFEGHTEPVKSVSLSLDGRWALSGSGDKTLRLWEVLTGRCLRTFVGHTSDVTSVCVSPDSRWALSGSNDHSLRLWELSSGRCVRTLTGHTDDVTSLCLSSDGRLALSGSGVYEKALRLWDVSTGRCLRTFEGHTKMVKSVCLSADGQWALSGSDDKTVRLWDATSGQCVRTFEGHTNEVNSVCLSSDSRWALSASGTHLGRDNTIRLWELDWEFEAHDPAMMDEGARPYLEIFLRAHQPYGPVLPNRLTTDEDITLSLKRQGRPNWSEDDFKGLINTLGYAGYGWLSPEGVRRELEQMTAAWIDPK